jgi:hypothetical protein
MSQADLGCSDHVISSSHHELSVRLSDAESGAYGCDLPPRVEHLREYFCSLVTLLFQLSVRI